MCNDDSLVWRFSQGYKQRGEDSSEAEAVVSLARRELQGIVTFCFL